MILFRISDIRGCDPTVRFKEPCPDQGDDSRSVRSEDPPRSSHDIHEVSNLTKSKKLCHLVSKINNFLISKRSRFDIKVFFFSFIANTGGLLGLCLGFSTVSLAELLYNFFLKRY